MFVNRKFKSSNTGNKLITVQYLKLDENMKQFYQSEAEKYETNNLVSANFKINKVLSTRK